MKFTNKWIVIPYNSIDKKKHTNITDQILRNKSLSKEEKLASYNNYIIRKLNKQKLKNQDVPETLNDSQLYQSEDEWDEYSEYEDQDSTDESISFVKTPNKKDKFASQDLPMDINNETIENIQNLSMYNVPASRNTRSMRKISDKTFMHYLR